MIIGVIPARLESTRFPRKILFPIDGKPMVMHVYERALKANKLDKLIVAADSQITVDALTVYDIDIVLTSSEHRSGTDRIAEVVKNIDADVVINIQADEPRIDPIMINKLISAFDDQLVGMATLASRGVAENDLDNPNLVKVTIDKNFNAENFFRNIEDYQKKYLRHIGIYGYRKDILQKFTKLKQSKREKKLQLEQLRAIDNGIPIRIVMCEYAFHGIDTPEDLEQLNIK